MLALLGSLLAGCVMGMGLAISQMMNPGKVLGFLDFLGNWDPTLATVLVGAIAAAVPGFWFVRRRSRPIFEAGFHFPQTKNVDAKLIGGAVIFGVGWGLVGFCPGPALAALSVGSQSAIIFVASMVAGMVAYRLAFPSK